MHDTFSAVWYALTSQTFWSAIGAVATVIASAGIFLAVRQLRFTAWLKAQDIFTDEEFTRARTMVLQRFAGAGHEWTQAEQEAGILVCRKMDELSCLAPFLGRRRILKTWDDPLAKSWLLLESMVKAERQKAGWPTKWNAFENLARVALAKLRKEGREIEMNTGRIVKEHNMAREDILTLLLKRRQHQDNLIHTRLNWFIVSQSFLFTAYAISQGQANASKSNFSCILPLLGLATSVTVYLSIIGGILTFKSLRLKLNMLDEWKLVEVERGGFNNWLWVGFLAAVLVPPAFIVAWAYVLIYMRG